MHTFASSKPAEQRAHLLPTPTRSSRAVPVALKKTAQQGVNTSYGATVMVVVEEEGRGWCEGEKGVAGGRRARW